MKITILRGGGKALISLEELRELIMTKDYIALPKEEFEKYYKRMKMSPDAREYHRNLKRLRK